MLCHYLSVYSKHKPPQNSLSEFGACVSSKDSHSQMGPLGLSIDKDGSRLCGGPGAAEGNAAKSLSRLGRLRNSTFEKASVQNSG